MIIKWYNTAAHDHKQNLAQKMFKRSKLQCISNLVDHIPFWLFYKFKISQRLPYIVDFTSALQFYGVFGLRKMQGSSQVDLWLSTCFEYSYFLCFFVGFCNGSIPREYGISLSKLYGDWRDARIECFVAFSTWFFLCVFFLVRWTFVRL